MKEFLKNIIKEEYKKLNEVSNELHDIVKRNFVSVISSFCARIYSKRRNKTNVEKIIKELEI